MFRMTRHTIAMVIAFAVLSSSNGLAQPSSVNLSLPVDHSGTGIAHRFGDAANVFVFSAKTQPHVLGHTAFYPAYVVVSGASGGGQSRTMTNPEMAVYPSLVRTGGPTCEESFSTVDAFDYLGYYAQHAGRRDPYDPFWGGVYHINQEVAPYVSSTARSVRCLLVGVDRTEETIEGSYFQFHAYGGDPTLGYDWEVVPTLTIPAGKAMYSLAIGGETCNYAVAAATNEVEHPVWPRIPLVTGWSLTDNLWWTGNLGPVPAAEWHDFDPDPLTDDLRNLQVSMCLDWRVGGGWSVFAVGLNGETGEFVTYSGAFDENNVLTGWSRLSVNSTLLSGAIPYDLKAVFRGLEEVVPVLFVGTSVGFFYSDDGGLTWESGMAGTPDPILPQEIRRISVAEGTQEWRHLAVAGWYASYVGEVDDNWNFTWHEIGYTPTLYQHWNHVWTGLAVGPEGSVTSVALINHAEDEIYPEDKPVVLQVQQTFGGSPQAQKTIYLGSQDEGTHPFMSLDHGLGNPWLVYNREGVSGPIVKYAQNQSSMDWDSVALFDDGVEGPVSASDVAASPLGNFVMFDNGQTYSHVNQLWRNTVGTRWEAATANGIELDMLNGFIAANGSHLYYLYPVADYNGFLYKSADLGDNFALITYGANVPPGWTQVHFNALGTGFGAGMPVYPGGTVYGTQTGRLFRFADGATPPWATWDCSLGEITQTVADPYDGNVTWVATHNTATQPYLLLLTYDGQSFSCVKWWGPSGPDMDQYDVVDIQILPTSTTHRILTLALKTPDSNEEGVDHTKLKRWEFDVAGPDVPLPASVSGTWVLAGEVTIPDTQTVTVESGTTFLCAPMAKLTVEGSLVVEGTLGDEVTFRKVAEDQSDDWGGLSVQGSASLTHCTIEGAEIGVESNQAASLVLTSCTIHDCGTGLYAYQPTGASPPQISGCTFADNEGKGICLFGTAGAWIAHCQISGNSGPGILLTNSYAKLHENRIFENGYADSYYGLECYGSSPVLYCNEFENNMEGEIGLFNQSYPILWNDNGAGGGGNTLTNENTTLITMSDSYPLLTDGDNNFYLGERGYFLADMTKKPPKHDISGNYWNPKLSLDLLYPDTSSVWTWSSTNPTPSECVGGLLSFNGGPEQLFAEGFSAEMNGNPATAAAAYGSLLTTYPDSTLAMAAAARRFEIARQTDTSLVDLRAYLQGLAEAHPEDTLLVRAAEALVTWTQVEDQEYPPALATYVQIMLNPPSELDSAYAALDHAVTLLRQEYEGRSGGGLDSEAPVVGISTLANLMRRVHAAVPEAPTITHAGYVKPPNRYMLEQNYPNPFNAQTTIRYYLPDASRVEIEVYNVLGRRVASLADGFEAAGYHDVRWDASSVASGVYIYQIKAGNFVDSKKMVLIR